MKLLVMGGTGLLGSTLVKAFAARGGHDVHFSYRSPPAVRNTAATGHYLGSLEEQHLAALVADLRPDVVINCIGYIKQKQGADDVLAVIPVNTLLPHRLAKICSTSGARLIHFSTDCVFSGKTGDYADDAQSDVNDLYGLSKFLGEVRDQPHVLTLRTSIIGELAGGTASLVDWFLAQEGTVKGYNEAIFSGLTTDEVANVLLDHVLAAPGLHGLYNLSAEPISKFDLLELVANVYGKPVRIEPSRDVRINRSLNSARFRAAAGYHPPAWPDMIRAMHEFHRVEKQ